MIVEACTRTEGSDEEVNCSYRIELIVIDCCRALSKDQEAVRRWIRKRSVDGQSVVSRWCNRWSVIMEECKWWVGGGPGCS